jgi:hypothetical protein
MKVCIESQEDGTYCVYDEPAGDAAEDGDVAAQMAAPEAGPAGAAPTPAAPPGEADEESGAHMADNIDDALMMAKQLLEQSSSEGDDSDNPATGGAPLPPDQAKAMWNQMAEKKMKAKASMGRM